MQTPSHRRGQLPKLTDPVPFNDGHRTGWKVAFPGAHPLATPAVADGRLFLGSGFGSYEFYALDAVTGRFAWGYQTSDDGPTAAVVWEKYVAFNTESCELEILTVDGRPLWKKWLGDPLMSMPAMGDDRVFLAFPNSRGDRKHYLGCFDLATAAELWRAPLPGEVITAPVLADGHVYASTLGGVLTAFRQSDGFPAWAEPRNATSAPAVWGGQCFFSQREPSVSSTGEVIQTEHVAGKRAFAGAETRTYDSTRRAADYLDHAKRAHGSPCYEAYSRQDASVGFNAHKGDGKLEQSIANLGHSQVSAVWAYQGSKPFLARQRLYSCLGDTVHCVDLATGIEVWKRHLHDALNGQKLLDAMLTPPAIVNGKLFIGTLPGEVYCLSAATGETLWKAVVGEPVLFQPAVAAGRVYVPTNSGMLYCLETGDPADDGWTMWGGGPHHNGRPD